MWRGICGLGEASWDQQIIVATMASLSLVSIYPVY